MDILDIFIIGAGPIGLACGIEAREAGLSYVIADKGCLVNSLYNYPQNMTFFSTSEKLEIGGVPFVSNSPKPTRAESLEYYRRVALKFELRTHLFEEVQEVAKVTSESNAGKGDIFNIRTSKATYQAKNVIVSTGFYDIPNHIGIEGEQLPKVAHYYKDPHYYAMQDVIVVGASNSSVDAALETYRKGARVTMVVRDKDISKRVKYWVRPDIINRIEEGSIKAYFSSSLVAVREHDADIQTPDGLVTIKNDFVLALTGYQPDMDLLKRFNISCTDDESCAPQHDAETMETNIKGLYLAGVVCGGMDTHLWFIENSRNHATRIIKDITEKRV